MPLVPGIYRGRDLWALGRRPAELSDLLPQLADKARLMLPRGGHGRVHQVVRQLVDDGVAILPDVVSAEFIEAARADLDQFVREAPDLRGTTRVKPASTGGTREYEVHEWQPDLDIYRTHDPLMVLPGYVDFLLLPELMKVAAGYLGRRWFYQAMIATRPGPTTLVDRRGFAGWHHDARGQKLNAILLMSDVGTDGSATVVIRGSHRLVYSRARRLRNFLPDGEIELLCRHHGYDEVVASAAAGSIVFFDSQALHRGRRSPHARDAYQVNLMTKRSHLWPHEISLDQWGALPPRSRRLLGRRSDLTVVA
jgi:hypothetical protein